MTEAARDIIVKVKVVNKYEAKLDEAEGRASHKATNKNAPSQINHEPSLRQIRISIGAPSSSRTGATPNLPLRVRWLEPIEADAAGDLVAVRHQ